jgi:hypothetical protein
MEKGSGPPSRYAASTVFAAIPPKCDGRLRVPAQEHHVTGRPREGPNRSWETPALKIVPIGNAIDVYRIPVVRVSQAGFAVVIGQAWTKYEEVLAICCDPVADAFGRRVWPDSCYAATDFPTAERRERLAIWRGNRRHGAKAVVECNPGGVEVRDGKPNTGNHNNVERRPDNGVGLKGGWNCGKGCSGDPAGRINEPRHGIQGADSQNCT